MAEAKRCRTCGHPMILYGDTWKCLVCGPKVAQEKDSNRKSVIVKGLRDRKQGEKKEGDK